MEETHRVTKETEFDSENKSISEKMKNEELYQYFLYVIFQSTIISVITKDL